MDSKITYIEQLIQEKKDKYPNIINVWEKYIDQKKLSLDKLLDNAIHVLENIDQMQETDIDFSTIMAIYILLSNTNH